MNRLPLIMNGKAETPLHFEVYHDLGVLKLTADETVKKLEDAQHKDIERLNNNNNTTKRRRKMGKLLWLRRNYYHLRFKFSML